VTQRMRSEHLKPGRCGRVLKFLPRPGIGPIVPSPTASTSTAHRARGPHRAALVPRHPGLGRASQSRQKCAIPLRLPPEKRLFGLNDLHRRQAFYVIDVRPINSRADREGTHQRSIASSRLWVPRGKARRHDSGISRKRCHSQLAADLLPKVGCLHFWCTGLSIDDFGA
jgi:hypothetical protein